MIVGMSSKLIVRLDYRGLSFPKFWDQENDRSYIFISGIIGVFNPRTLGVGLLECSILSGNYSGGSCWNIYQGGISV